MPYPLVKSAKKAEAEAPSVVRPDKTIKTVIVTCDRIESDCYNVTAYWLEVTGPSVKVVETKQLATNTKRVLAIGWVQRFRREAYGRTFERGAGLE